MHKKNEDPYNLLNDKNVQLHKMKGRVTVVNDTAHEMRFEPLPNNGLPSISSKNKIKLSHVDMDRGDGR